MERKELIVDALKMLMLQNVCPGERLYSDCSICNECPFRSAFDCKDRLHRAALQSQTGGYMALKELTDPGAVDRIIVNTSLTDKDLYLAVTRALKQIGAPPHLDGYKYVREAIILVVKDSENLDGITKGLYWKVANMFGRTPSQVERAIRHLVESIYDRCDYEILYKMFANTVSPRRGKPVNSEFIALIAENVRLELNFGEAV